MDKKNLLKARETEHRKNISDALNFINLFVDNESFVENNNYLTFSDITDNFSDAIVTGYATINNRPIIVAAQNATIKQGGFSKTMSIKLKEAMKSAISKEIPFIFAIDSFGADIREGLDILLSYSKILRKSEKLKSICPFIVIVKGYAVGNMALLTAAADFVIALDNSIISFNSPAVVLAEDNKAFEPQKYIGCINACENGLATICTDKKNLGAKLIKLLNYLPLNVDEACPINENAEIDSFNKEVNNIESMDSKEFINSICDKNSYIELYEKYCPALKCGLLQIGGQTAGIAMMDRGLSNGSINNGIVRKYIRFLRIINKFNIPFINIVDCDGVEISLSLEQSDFYSNLAELYSMLNSTSPKIALIKGNAIGIAYTLFASMKMFDSVLAWSTAQISPLTAEAGGIIMYSDKIKNVQNAIKSREEAMAAYKDIDGDAYNAACRGLVNIVLNPEDTKQYLLSQIQMVSLLQK